MIVVNPSTRQFDVPGADLVFGVTADSGSERKYFKCPRYVGDNLDVAGSFIRINYRNANGQMDSYLAEDVAVDGDNVTFSWLLHPKVTAYKGQIKFVMCVVGADLKVKWHTTQGTGQVLEGIEPDASLVEAQTADVVAQLIDMMERQTAAVEAEGGKQIKAVQAAADAAEAASVAEIEAKGASTLATIPGEYTATVSAVQSAANAIRGKVSGEVIRVDDVSPMEHYPAVKVSGKNLIPCGTISFEKNRNYALTRPIPPGTYTLSAHITSDDTDGEYSAVSINSKGSVMKYTTLKRNERASTTFTVTEQITNIDFCAAYNYSQGVGDSATWSDIQLEAGSVATEYTPYVDPAMVTVRLSGKNLLNFDEITDGSGATHTFGDGKLTVTGYFSSYTDAMLKPGARYTVSFDSTRTGDGGGGVAVEFYRADDSRITGTYKQNELSATVSFTVPVGTKKTRFYFYGSAGSSGKDSAIYSNLQIESGGEKTAYEPYTGETQIPAADGTVSGLSAVSPTMTLLTDTAGVNIECEYSRDTNKVIAELLEKITALGG